jgi:hypothetical protein
MQTCMNVKDPSIRELVSVAANREPYKFKTPAAISAELALEMNKRWERSIREKISLFVRQARAAKRDEIEFLRRATYEPNKGELPRLRFYHKGRVQSFIACARQLKGLL